MKNRTTPNLFPASARPNGRRATAGKAGLLLALAATACLLAGCETDGTTLAAAKPTEAPKPPMTHQLAAEQCWMSTEGNKALDANLDKRADVVTKCIADKMKAAGS
ncbi:MAG: hypothetical protein GC182_06245 [Rhodopseudomonas sp.]|nr:hypothetical protein [Rhodopseudomonas sp.]